MTLVIIFELFAIAFFGNLLVDYQFIPAEVTLLTELSAYLLLCLGLIRSGQSRAAISIHLSYLYGAFLLVAIISAVLNGGLSQRIFIGLRPILRFYIFYLALINLRLSEKQYKAINILLFVIFILQLPASGIRFLQHGFAEHTIGTYAAHGGGITPIIPIIAIGYLAGFFIFCKPKPIHLLLGAGFVMFGIMGAKRVLFFLLPASLIGIYYLGYVKGKKTSLIKQLPLIVIVIGTGMAVQLFMMKNIASLNPEYKEGGTASYSHVLEYAQKYEAGKGAIHGAGGGRFSTTLIGFETIFGGDIAQTFFGFGPGSTMKSKFDSERRVDKRLISFVASYGQTGFAFLLVEYGLFGAITLSLVFFIFISRSLRWFRLENDPYWKSMSMGTVVFSFLYAFIFFCYNRVPLVDDTTPPVYFYAMSLAFYRLNEMRNKAAVLIPNRMNSGPI
jgi:hypothetical protein